MERLTETRGGEHQVKSVFTSTYAEKRKGWSILNTVAQRKSVKFPVSFCLPSLEIEKVCVCVSVPVGVKFIRSFKSQVAFPNNPLVIVREYCLCKQHGGLVRC